MNKKYLTCFSVWNNKICWYLQDSLPLWNEEETRVNTLWRTNSRNKHKQSFLRSRIISIVEAKFLRKVASSKSNEKLPNANLEHSPTAWKWNNGELWKSFKRKESTKWVSEKILAGKRGRRGEKPNNFTQECSKSWDYKDLLKNKNQQTEDHGDSILTQLGQGWGREQDRTLCHP